MPRPEWAEEVVAAIVAIEGMESIAEDPVLIGILKESQIAMVLHWAVSNIQHPTERVLVDFGSSAVESVRYLMRRGLDNIPAEAYRACQNVNWRKWMQVCFDATSDADQLRQLLDISMVSYSTFANDCIVATKALVEAERAEGNRGGQEAEDTVNLILEGAPISRITAETKLSYGLLGPHTAAIIWSEVGAPARQLESVAEAVREALGASRRLTIVANADVLWLWLPVRTLPGTSEFVSRLPENPDVRIALGRPGDGVEGFRRTHLHALATHRMMARLTSPQLVAQYHDVQLVAAITNDLSLADEFIGDTLGSLVSADAETRLFLLTFIREEFNASRTAEVLYTHRNTVNRRLIKAENMLPRPLSENVVNVAAALEVLQWRGSIA